MPTLPWYHYEKEVEKAEHEKKKNIQGKKKKKTEEEIQEKDEADKEK